MNLLPFIKKDHADLPDAYGIKIDFIDGTELELEIASHRHVPASGTFEIVTKDDEWKLFPVSGIKAIHFDKRFSKIVAIKEASKNAPIS
jgi:hypothetical protein